jgi:hypothetical protein
MEIQPRSQESGGFAWLDLFEWLSKIPACLDSLACHRGEIKGTQGAVSIC